MRMEKIEQALVRPIEGVDAKRVLALCEPQRHRNEETAFDCAERGATVITQLAGRSAASAARAERAGAIPVSTDDEFVRQADFILSIVPPGDAVALAQRLAPTIKRAGRKIVYVDCNAISPQTAE